MNVKIECKTASGKSLEELSRLIALRSQEMGEMAQDAVIATGINVLNSLRSSTRDAQKNRKPGKASIIKHRADLFVSFRDGKSHTPCVRIGSPHGAQDNKHWLHFASKGIPIKQLKVFEVFPEHERMHTYYVAAADEKQAREYEVSRIAKRVKMKGGLAKTTLGIAMAKISTRNVATSSSRLAHALASELGHISIHGSKSWIDGSGEFGLAFNDRLNYAIPALKGGASDINLAIQKAANKTAGIITQAMRKAGNLEAKIPTPFPEVKKRR